MPRSEDGPIRILHVLGAMNFGGVETWLLQVLRHIDRRRFHMDFFVEFAEQCPDRDEIHALGGRVIDGAGVSGWSRPWWYARHLRRILREHGPYDVIHTHLHHANGYVLRLARCAGVPVRISHSHLETAHVRATAGLVQRGYTALMTRWIVDQATLGLATSGKAASELFGPDWLEDARWRIHPCGLYLEPFAEQVDRGAVRAELGLPDDAFVVGHVGRFHPQKNHAFLIDVVAESARRDPRVFLLLVGDGPLRPSIERQIADAGLGGRAMLAGQRRDVPRLMLGAMDAVVFPSLFEGLGLVLVEAQAAGLPCLVADNVPAEADLVRALIHRLPLSEAAATWAEAVLRIGRAEGGIPQREALRLVRKSAFDIGNEVSALEDLYRMSVRRVA